MSWSEQVGMFATMTRKFYQIVRNSTQHGESGCILGNSYTIEEEGNYE